MKVNLRLFLILASLEVIWAPVNYCIVVAEQGGFSPAGIGLIRWIGVSLGFFLLLAIPWFRRRTRARFPISKDVLLSILIGLLITGPSHLMYYAALQKTETVEGTVFNASAPLWMALFATWVLQENVSLRRWGALAVGGLGAYIASVGFALPTLKAGHLAWNGIYLLGTLLECFGGALLARIIRRSSGVTAFAWETMGRSLAMIVFPLILPSALPLKFGNPLLTSHFLWGIAAIGYLITIAGLLTFGTWVVIVETVPLSLMVVTIALQTPVAAVLGHFLLGEALAPGLFAGAVIIFCGLGIAATDKSELAPKIPILEPTLFEVKAT